MRSVVIGLASVPLLMAIASGASAQHDQPTPLAPAMIAAGAAAAAAAGEADPEGLAKAVYEAMAAVAWQPIGTAPQDGRFILLGTWDGDRFVTGIGQWVVFDDPGKPGHWSLEDWWTTPVTHWAPVPPAPKRAP